MNSVNFNNERYGRLSSVIEYIISNEHTTFIKYLQEKTELFKDSIDTLISLAPSKTLQDILINGDPEYYGKLTTPEQLHKYLNAELHIRFNSAPIIDKYTTDWNAINNDGCNVLHLLTKEVFNHAIKNNGQVESQYLQNLNKILKDITTVAQINFE